MFLCKKQGFRFTVGRVFGTCTIGNMKNSFVALLRQKGCSYNLLSSGLGVLSNSLARLTYSQGRPLESTLSSRPACGNSVGLWRDVKLVSRHSLCGGVPIVNEPHFVGLGGDSSARISCSISISCISIASRASEASADEPDGRRCGFVGPSVVTT